MGRGAGLRIGYSETTTTVAQQRMLRAAFSTARWKSDGGVIEELRCVKDASEIAVMREAAVLISDVWQKVVNGIKPGLSELEIAARIEHGIKLKGGSGPSFDTIVAAGPRSAWAHAQPSLKPLAKNELVVLDQGAILRGYCSDLTRTIHIGKASARVKHLYSAVLEAQAAAKAAIRPGATAGDVDAAARRALQKRRLAQYFTHSTGHGLGLEIHERPRLGKGDKTVLLEGMVITVEPGVYIEGVGGIRIEDDVVVTASGYTELTTATREFLEL